jgi:hypothetical protein
MEALQSHAAPGGEVQLLQAHLLAGNLPGTFHESGTDALGTESGARLQMADGAPMAGERARITLRMHPAGQVMAGATIRASWSGGWNPHAGLLAIGSQQGEGDRRGAGVAYVAHRCPRVPGHARVDDVIRDAPESRDIGDSTVPGNVG